MKIPPRLVIIGPEPGIRRTYNLIGFPIIIGASERANITVRECNLADQHIYIEKVDESLKIRQIGDNQIIHDRMNIKDKSIEDRDVFVAGKIGLQFFVPQFDTETDDDLVLEFLTSANIGKKVLFNEDLTIGRKEKNSICFPYKKVSGNHGVFKFGESTTFVDLQSRNGSRINGKKISGDTPIEINVGDIIDVASHAFYLRPESYNRKKVDEKMFLYLSEALKDEPAFDEYSPTSDYSQIAEENIAKANISSGFTPASDEDNILLEISSDPKHKLIDNTSHSAKVSEFEVEEMSVSESISDSIEDIESKIRKPANQDNSNEADDEDLLYLGPDEDFDASGFNKMLAEMQENSKPSLMETEKMPKMEDEFVDIKDWNAGESTEEKKYKGKNILSDTYFNKIKKSDIDEANNKKDENQN